jgi:hypothetical protein
MNPENRASLVSNLFDMLNTIEPKAKDRLEFAFDVFYANIGELSQRQLKELKLRLKDVTEEIDSYID